MNRVCSMLFLADTRPYAILAVAGYLLQAMACGGTLAQVQSG